MGELHRRFGDALAALADTDSLARALDQADGRPDWWPVGAAWRRTFGRFEPEKPAYATLAIESDNAPAVIALIKASRSASEEGWTVTLPGIGAVAIRPFPDDPNLPTLGRVCATPGEVRVVRYRPEKRCTLRVDDGQSVSWVKVYPGQGGLAIHRIQTVLWDASQRGELEVAVAQAIRFDPETHAAWIGHVPGAMVTSRLFGVDGPALARRLGAAAGSVTTARIDPEARLDGAAQLERSRRNAATVARYLPELAEPLAEVIRGLERLHARGVARPCPIHGAPHPEQWLEDRGRLGLIDFDRFSYGDPELDVTTFQAEVDFERVPDGLRAEINAGFLDGYESRAGAMDPSLLTAYRIHKRLAKVVRSARAIRPDGDERAARHLGRVLELVRGEATE